MVAEHARDGGDDGVRILRLDAHQQSDGHHVGNDVGEQSGVLDLTRHDGVRDARLLQQVDPGSELAQGHAVQRRGRRLRGRGLEFRKGLLLQRDDRDVVTGRPSGVENEEGKPAIAGDQSEVHASRPRAGPRSVAWRDGE